jgi:predicted O-methyltransferase YrrM
MGLEQWIAVDEYISNLLIPADPILAATLNSSLEAGLPQINISPNQGKFLQLMVQITKASNILEIGTLGGYSTIWLARALPGNGHLITIEADLKHALVARSNIELAKFTDKVDIYVGKALDILPELYDEGRGPFDFIFIDADKINNVSYFSWALKLSSPGTVIIVDNVVRDGEVLNENSDDQSVIGTRAFNEVLAKETRVNATIMQTVGNKGYDGFAIMLVTSK